MEAVILDNVYYRYPSTNDWILKGVSLNLRERRVLIAGDTGSGKSTLLRVIAGIAVKVYGGELRGSVDIKGKPVLVPQNFDAYILMPTPRAEIMYILENRGLSQAEARRVLSRISAALGIRQVLDRSVSALSMGERQRVAIASALALEPDILLLDEPLAYIDPMSVMELLDAVEEASPGMIIAAEHRIQHLREWLDYLVVLEDGRVALQGELSRLTEALTSPIAGRTSSYYVASLMVGGDEWWINRVKGCMGEGGTKGGHP